MTQPPAPKKKRPRPLSAEVDPDDGADPRYFFRKTTRRRSPKPGRKSRQLAQQVAEAVGGLLAETSGDEVLAGLDVVGVEPAPDSSTLLVSVARSAGSAPVPPVEILDRLARASGRLRTGVAASITRKKAPVLVYRVVEPAADP